MTYSKEKIKGQRSVGSKGRVETNRWTDRWTKAIALPLSLMQSLKAIAVTVAVVVCSDKNMSDMSYDRTNVTNVTYNTVRLHKQ